MRSRDAKRVAVRVSVNLHRSELAKPALNSIADRLLVDRKEIKKVLETWTRAELAEWLEQFTEEELCRPARQRFRSG